MSVSITTIQEYFPSISVVQQEQLKMLPELYAYWNERINLISRKDIDQLYERHVLHSFAIAKVISFADNSCVLDVGTGGGFPGIPLSIMFPSCKFTLVDSIGKKIMVVNEVAQALKLKNVVAKKARAEELKENFDFVVSRAVTDLPTFTSWIWNKINKGNKSTLPNGILYLKGGDLLEELKATKYQSQIFDISSFFKEDFFETKKVVYIKK